MDAHDSVSEPDWTRSDYREEPTPVSIPHIPNHLAKAILTTILCCLPFGIVSIVYASSVNGKMKTRDYRGALTASDQASIWANWGIGLGAVFNALYFVIVLLGE